MLRNVQLLEVDRSVMVGKTTSSGENHPKAALVHACKIRGAASRAMAEAASYRMGDCSDAPILSFRLDSGSPS